jgi:hypothetical protein
LGRRVFPDPPEMSDARRLEPLLRQVRVQPVGPP